MVDPRVGLNIVVKLPCLGQFSLQRKSNQKAYRTLLKLTSFKQRIINQMRSLFKQVELRSAERDQTQSIVNRFSSYPLAPRGLSSPSSICLPVDTFQQLASVQAPRASLRRQPGLARVYSLCPAQDCCSTQSPCLEIASWLEVLLASPMLPTVHLPSKGAVALSQRVPPAPGCGSQDQIVRQPLFL